MENTREWFEQNRNEYNFEEFCVNCKSNKNLVLHHIVPLGAGGTNLQTNIVYLCDECHGIVHDMNLTNWKKLQSEGIKRAQANGVVFGRPSAEKPDNWDEIIPQWLNGQITSVKAMELLGLKRTTFYKLIKNDNISLENKKINELKTLQTENQEMIDLYIKFGSYKAVAEKIGCSASTVSKRLKPYISLKIKNVNEIE